MKQSSILAIGSVAFDSIESPSGKADRVLGGSANYFSIAASFFNPVKIVAVVGEDFPQSHLDWLQERNIDVSGVEKVSGKTFHWAGSYTKNLNEAQTLATELNVFESFKPKLSTDHKNSSVLFLANIDPVLQLDVLEQMDNPKFVACDTMNFWIQGKLHDLKKVISKIDLLSINETEAALLSNQKNLLRAADIIREMGPKVLVVKRGEYGSICFTPRGYFTAPAFLVPEVVDPTGAGDSFAGAMMGFLANSGISRDLVSKNPEEFDKLIRQAVLHGSVMASFTVEDFSMHRLKRLSRDEFDMRMKKMSEAIRF